MSHTLVLDSRTTCQLRNDSHLACQLEGDPFNVTFFAKETRTLPRPPMCDLDPEYAAKHAGGVCQFHASNGTMSCGCPELDNPQLKSAYERAVIDFVLNLAKKQTTITLTFFASGGLRNECNIISKILSELEDRSWAGELNIQFVDPEYTVHKTQQVQKGSGHLQVNWNYAIGAGAAGIIGVGCILAGTKQKDQKVRTYCYIAGAISLIIALGLCTQIPASEPKKRKVEKLAIKQPYISAIQGTMQTLQERLPASIKLNPTFFSSAQVCIRDGEKMDGIFAYDFGGNKSKQDCLSLKGERLKNHGCAILVGKEAPTPHEMGTPFFMRAQGPTGRLHRLDWTRI